MKLHLGCGKKRKEGWVNVDANAGPNVDLAHDLMSPLPYEAGTATEILAEDLLEHFDNYSRYYVMFDWVRTLQKGGVIQIQVPNFKKLMLKYLYLKFEHFVDAIFAETHWGSKEYISHYGNHKWGYSKKSLHQFLSSFGLKKIELKSSGNNILARYEKVEDLSITEFYQNKIYSYANDKGNGVAYVTIGEIFNKIEAFKRNASKHEV